MFSEDELLPISALQHLLFCERQCALIHIERLWAENRLTVEGRHLHEKAHGGRGERRDGAQILRGLPLRSLRLGLAGVADVVELHPAAARDGPTPATAQPADVAAPAGAAAPPGTPFPVEYKRGRPKSNDCDRIQLCAQALCLEEMLGVAVPAGALFYGRTRRRQDVLFDADLRSLTEQAAARLHELIAAGVTPVVPPQRKCRNCSLVHQCLPQAGGRRSVQAYMMRRLREGMEVSQADPGGADA